MGVMFRKMARAPLGGLFTHKTDKIHRDGQSGESILAITEPLKHGRHRALGVRGSATVDFAIAKLAAKGVDGHAANAYGVEMGS